MPYCTQCGGAVGGRDVFCAGCGAPQQPAQPAAGGAAPDSPSPRPSHGRGQQDFLTGIHPRKAALLCYIPFLGWIMSIIVLAVDRFRGDRTVRFHAFQGLYLFVLWLFVDWVFGPITSYTESTRVFGKVLKLAVLGGWIFMIVKVHSGSDFRLPLLGDLADRSVAEQR